MPKSKAPACDRFQGSPCGASAYKARSGAGSQRERPPRSHQTAGASAALRSCSVRRAPLPSPMGPVIFGRIDLFHHKNYSSNAEFRHAAPPCGADPTRGKEKAPEYLRSNSSQRAPTAPAYKARSEASRQREKPPRSH